MFFSKAPWLWSGGSNCVQLSDGAEQTRVLGLNGLVGGKGDPFVSVIATKPQ